MRALRRRRGERPPTGAGWLESYDLTHVRGDTVDSPIGIDIGAETVREIAVSISAELIRHRRARPEIEIIETNATATPEQQ